MLGVGASIIDFNDIDLDLFSLFMVVSKKIIKKRASTFVSVRQKTLLNAFLPFVLAVEICFVSLGGTRVCGQTCAKHYSEVARSWDCC